MIDFIKESRRYKADLPWWKFVLLLPVALIVYLLTGEE
jgi:hypothetical protein